MAVNDRFVRVILASTEVWIAVTFFGRSDAYGVIRHSPIILKERRPKLVRDWQLHRRHNLSSARSHHGALVSATGD